jgi:abortive infection bacteriophage resistance protein
MSQQPSGSRPAYPKPWLSYADQVQKLVDRGLTVGDRAAAEAFLAHINYYRFSGYCLAFEQQRHQFAAGVTFEQVCASYDFDMGLRDLVVEALEVVEVDFRAKIAYHFGNTYGAFGHVDAANFFFRFDHADWIDRLREEAGRSSELFVTHFSATYAEFPDLPVWMAMEIMSFGSLSKMFSGMVRDDQKKIARLYAMQPLDLRSWMHHLVYIRNLCAHHSRLWDRQWAITPALPAARMWQPPSVPNSDRLFATLLILHYLMRSCPAIKPFVQGWKARVEAHVANPPAVANHLASMGLPPAWQQHPVWK